MKLRGKTAVVTGGSRGIGRVVAEFLAREGAAVFVIARDEGEVRAAVQEINEVAGGKAIARGGGCDVADAKALARTMGGFGRKMRRIDILVNCAGVQAPIGSFADTTFGDWEHNIQVNLLGTAAAIKAALPFMRRGGSIVNFAGGGATSSRPNFSAYAVAKTGVVRFTEVLADELKPRGIRVNTVSPGGVNTAMLQEVLKLGARAGKAELARAKKQLATGGVTPELAAALVVFLASGESRGLTGRLISAPWDAWRTWDKKMIKKIMATEALTLRRVLPSKK